MKYIFNIAEALDCYLEVLWVDVYFVAVFAIVPLITDVFW